MSASDVCVAVLAHPDDEVFLAGLLRARLEQGRAVHCAWITSGEASGGAVRREAELRRAVGILGLPDQAVHLARFPNRGLLPLLWDVAAWLAALFAALEPAEIFSTAYEGGHIDHDAVNWAVHKAWTTAAPLAATHEFPLYNRTGPWLLRGWRINDFPPGSEGVRHFRPSRAQLACKYSLMRTYRSQWPDLLPFRMLMPARRYLRTGEPFRPLPRQRDYSIPPHAGWLNYERNPGRFSFRDFADAVRAAEDRGLYPNPTHS